MSQRLLVSDGYLYVAELPTKFVQVHNPEDRRDLTGKCPPGSRWDGTRCVPNDEANLALDTSPAEGEVGGLTEAQAKLLLIKLLTRLFAKTRQQESMSEREQAILKALVVRYPELTKTRYQALARKYRDLVNSGKIVLDHGVPKRSHSHR